MSNKIVCNASPLIFLAKIGRLELLNGLFDEVLVPYSAWEEAIRKPDAMTKSLVEFQSADKLNIFTVQNTTAVSAMLGRLHIGEVEVIIGAGELSVPIVILDDGYARSKAKQMGLSVTGTLGILIAGNKNGFVDNLEYEIDKLRAVGFRISDSIIKQILSS